MKMKPLFKKFQAYCCPVIATILLSLTCAAAYAGPPEEHVEDHAGHDHANLGSQATNPLAPLLSLRLQYQNSPSNYNADSYSEAGIFQAVIPVPLPFKSVPMMLLRTTMPYISTPDVDPVGKNSGLSDTAILAFLIPDFGLKGHTIAMGASIGIPTAGDNDYTGSHQWTLGPVVGYLNTKTKGWQWGGMVYKNWNVSSTRSGAKDVNTTDIQPVVNYHFGSKGWYAGLPDLPQTYNHKTNNWTLNIGGVIGRVFTWHKQHLQMYGGVYYNPMNYDDDAVAGKWTMKFNLSFLIPE